MTQIKKAGQFWEKRLFSKTFFASVLITAREIRKTKGKNPDKICQLIFRKIYPHHNNRNNDIKILYVFTGNEMK